jgi:hypothetical protein
MKLRFLLTIVAATRLLPGAEAEFGPMGLASFETMRLSAFCAEAGAAPITQPCIVEFEFHRLDGTEVKSSTVTIAPGTGAFLDLRGSDAVGRASTVEIIPCIKVVSGPGAYPSLQVFDNFTTRTNLRASWSKRPAFLTGEGWFAPGGITGLDTARLTVMCEESATTVCEVELHFHNLQGKLVKQSRLSLKPGTGGSLDLRTPEIGVPTLGPASRVEIIPCYRVLSGRALGTFRILDALTGRTNNASYAADLLPAVDPPDPV